MLRDQLDQASHALQTRMAEVQHLQQEVARIRGEMENREREWANEERSFNEVPYSPISPLFQSPFPSPILIPNPQSPIPFLLLPITITYPFTNDMFGTCLNYTHAYLLIKDLRQNFQNEKLILYKSTSIIF